MIKFVGLLFMLFVFDCYSQHDARILLVPMQSKNVYLDNYVERMLKYNRVKMDSVEQEVSQFAEQRLKKHLPEYTFTNLRSIIEYSDLIDSLGIMYQWNSFTISKLNNSKGIERMKITCSSDPKYRYYGRIINDKEMAIFKNLIQQNNYKYIFFINRFETRSPRPFDRKTYLRMSFEIYDVNMNKLFGGISSVDLNISRKMYSDVFIYYIHNSVDDLYEKVNLFLNPPEKLND